MALLEADGPSVLWSRRFRKAYKRAGAGLQGLVDGAVHDFVNRWRAEPTTCTRHYDRLAQLPQVLEIDVTGARRMLAGKNPQAIILLDVGGKDIVPAYDQGKLFVDLLTLESAPPQFYPDADGLRLFASNPCRTFVEYGNELSREWVYFLSEQQHDVVREIVNASEHALGEVQPYTAFILGGPGTGKSSILLNLAKDFLDLGIQTRLVLTDPVAEYLDACLPDAELSRFRLSRVEALQWSEIEPIVLLVDDPCTAAEIQQYLPLTRSGAVGLLVLAFDPFQLDDAITDSELRTWVHDYAVKVFPVDECYRQKEHVGVEVKRVVDTIADSTPFIRTDKVEQFHFEHSGLSTLANTLRFPNPYGYLQVHRSLDAAAVESEMDRIISLPHWSHWPPLLVVQDVDLVRPAGVDEQLQRMNFRWCLLSNASEVKGTEFQHVFLLLSPQTFDRASRWFNGTGRATYNKLRLLRIPISRAKDSLVFFVDGS